MRSYAMTIMVAGLAMLSTGCSQHGDNASEKDAITARVDSSAIQYANVEVEKFKIANKVFANPEVTKAIAAYEEGKNASDRIRLVDGITSTKHWTETETETGPPTCPKYGGIQFVTSVTTLAADKFDLVIKGNDVAVQQLKMVNVAYNELDSGAVNAIAFYEKMSPADKMKVLTDETSFKPAPDYVQQYFARQFRLNYFFQRFQLAQLLTARLRQLQFVNEFPQGYSNIGQFGMRVDDRQFDLKIAKR